MISLLDFRGKDFGSRSLHDILPRAEVTSSDVTVTVQSIIDEVKEHGESALLSQAERFDGVRPASLRVPISEIKAAKDALSPAIVSALEEAIRRVRIASEAQVPAPARSEFSGGAAVLQRWMPIERAGLYIPGGKAVYPSSVVMNAVPAQVAGVKEIALVSPPQKEFGGSVHPLVLGAAGLLGITEVYACGGAGAIAALAYGVPGVLEPVDLVTGPGNVYVATAKRLLQSRIAIDAEAGPTEILIIADETADPSYLAADLLSQAEHDELAAAVLVTDSAEQAELVQAELSRQLALTPNRERATQAIGAQQSAIVLVSNLEDAVQFSNLYAPEHLSVQTRNASSLLETLTSAGAIFLGPYSPVSLGDYSAGSNHVLPTLGKASTAAGLSAMTFLKSQQIIDYSQQGLQEVSEQIIALAEAEQLPAHADAIRVRFR